MRLRPWIPSCLSVWLMASGLARGASAPAPDEARSTPPAKAEKSEKSERLHRAQNDGGGETPYKWELSLLSDFYQQNTNASDGTKQGSGHYDLTATGLYILHHNLEIGASLTYDETSEKYTDGTLDTTSEQLALLAAYNFGNLDKEVTIFFVDGGLAYGMTSQKTTGPDPASPSSSQFLLLAGGGVRHFLASRVAATAQAQAQVGSQKANSGPSATVLNLHFLRLGLSVFL